LFEQSKPRERKPTAVNDACLLPRIRALTDGSRREVMACVATSAAFRPVSREHGERGLG